MAVAELRKVLGPGLSTFEQISLKVQNATEDRLRLKWFFDNEERLKEISEVPSSVDRKKLQEELCAIIKDRQKLSLKYPTCKIPEPIPPKIVIDPAAFESTMRPVAKEHLDILYNTEKVHNRAKYLKLRADIKPDEKYYFPETTAFKYGWKAAEFTKNMKMVRHGKSRIVSQTFYRKNGSKTQDPEWYKECQRNSPTVCDCLG